MPSADRKLAEANLNFPVKIGAKNPVDIARLDQYLMALSKISGVKEAPNKAVREIWVGFILENFKGLSFEEIEKAFSLAFARKLDVEDVEHYGNITPQWIGKILSAYEQKRNKELIHFSREFEKIKNEAERTITDKEADKIMAESIVNHFAKYKETKDFTDLGSSVYNWLDKKGYINLSAEKKKIFMKQAEKSLLDKSLGVKSVNIFEKAVTSLKNGLQESIIISEAKTMIVKWFFDAMIKENREAKVLFLKYLKA